MASFSTTERSYSPASNSSESLIDIIKLHGDEVAFRYLKRDKNFSQDELNSALILACSFRYKLLIYKLVFFGADIETTDIFGNTPLLISAELSCINVVRFLLQRGVNVNVANVWGNTALILAIRPAESSELVKLLLAQESINVHHQNKDGYTALMKAIDAGDLEVIQLLLYSQGDLVRALDGIKNCGNETAQQIADNLGIKKISQLLSRYRIKEHQQLLAAVEACDVSAVNTLLIKQLLNSPNKSAIINDAFMRIFTAHDGSGEAFHESEDEIIEKLLMHGANVDGCSYRFHPIQVAVQVGSYNMLRILLKHRVNMRQSILCQVNSNPLKVAVTNGRHDLVKLLLRNGAEHLVIMYGISTLESALKNGHTKCAALLIHFGAIMYLKYSIGPPANKDKATYFMSVLKIIKSGHADAYVPPSIRSLLLSEKDGYVHVNAILTHVDGYANSLEMLFPLVKMPKMAVCNFKIQRHVIAEKYHAKFRDMNSPVVHFILTYSDTETKLQALKTLLKNNPHAINQKSFGGRTPLMVAVSKEESTEVVHTLLRYGADINTLDSKGNTVLLLAIEQNVTKNTMIILRYVKQKRIINLSNRRGLTPLMMAAENHDYHVMRYLLHLKAKVNVKDARGNNALLLALSRYCQELDILQPFIGTDYNFFLQQDSDFASKLLKGKTYLNRTVKMLIDAGVNVNLVRKTAPHETALSLLLKHFSCDSLTLSCMKYLLDHGADASYLNPNIIHKLCKEDQVLLMIKLIHCGLGPKNISAFEILPHMSPFVPTVSPLCLAFMMGNYVLALYFIEILFMTKLDITTLFSDIYVRRHLEANRFQKCLEAFDKLARQPMPLFSLAFVTVLSAVGTTPGRGNRVNLLPLPSMIKEKLLFHHRSKNQDILLDILQGTTILHFGESPDASSWVLDLMAEPLDDHYYSDDNVDNDGDVDDNNGDVDNNGDYEVDDNNGDDDDVDDDDDSDGDDYDMYNYISHEVDSSDDDYLHDNCF